MRRKEGSVRLIMSCLVILILSSQIVKAAAELKQEIAKLGSRNKEVTKQYFHLEVERVLMITNLINRPTDKENGIEASLMTEESLVDLKRTLGAFSKLKMLLENPEKRIKGMIAEPVRFRQVLEQIHSLTGCETSDMESVVDCEDQQKDPLPVSTRARISTILMVEGCKIQVLRECKVKQQQILSEKKSIEIGLMKLEDRLREMDTSELADGEISQLNERYKDGFWMDVSELSQAEISQLNELYKEGFWIDTLKLDDDALFTCRISQLNKHSKGFWMDISKLSADEISQLNGRFTKCMDAYQIRDASFESRLTELSERLEGVPMDISPPTDDDIEEYEFVDA